MSITTIASPASFASNNLGLLTMPVDCVGDYLFGTDYASSVVDQMGGAPLTLSGPIEYRQGYADFRGGSTFVTPTTTPARDRLVVLVGSSTVDEKILEGGAIVWPPMTGPSEMRYPGGAPMLEWNGGAQFLAVYDGGFFRSESGDIGANYAQKSNNPVAYEDSTFTPNFWGAVVSTSADLSALFNPQGQGVLALTQPFSGPPAAASRTTGGNRTGPASSHCCLSSVSIFPSQTLLSPVALLNFAMVRASRRLGYRITRTALDATA